MLHIVLVHPEIPPNTGNVIRLAANTGAQLHLVEPLGFDISDAQLRRAGLDYHEFVTLKVHRDWAACRNALGARRLFALTTSGRVRHTEAQFADEDAFVFGCETRGLPEAIQQEFPGERRIRLPMRPGNRSLNLSNAVAVTIYEAWRQLGFPGAAP